MRDDIPKLAEVGQFVGEFGECLGVGGTARGENRLDDSDGDTDTHPGDKRQ